MLTITEVKGEAVRNELPESLGPEKRDEVYETANAFAQECHLITNLNHPRAVLKAVVLFVEVDGVDVQVMKLVKPEETGGKKV